MAAHAEQKEEEKRLAEIKLREAVNQVEQVTRDAAERVSQTEAQKAAELNALQERANNELQESMKNLTLR